MVMQVETSKQYTLKYSFEYARLGGTDPFKQFTMQQMNAMKQGSTRGIIVFHLCITGRIG